MNEQNELLEADFGLGFTYTRSPGPIIGKFLAALQHRELWGIRGSQGDVLFPPTEYDPRDAAALGEFVRLGERGRLLSWTWIAAPRDHHLPEQPFAFGMIQIDGADVPFLHHVLCDDPAQLKAGMALQVQWADETVGAITDIAGFVPVVEGS